jgi:hypothetical protein
VGAGDERQRASTASTDHVRGCPWLSLGRPEAPRHVHPAAMVGTAACAMVRERAARAGARWAGARAERRRWGMRWPGARSARQGEAAARLGGVGVVRRRKGHGQRGSK